MLIKTPCGRCGVEFEFYLADEVAGNQILRQYALRGAFCKTCKAIADNEKKQSRQAEMLAEREAKLADTYRERLESSHLESNYLGFDPKHPNANLELNRMIGENRYRSLWICGATGIGKTRCLQYHAAKLLRNRSVLYYRAFDLMAMLSEEALNIDRALRPVYQADLLIIDDLGKEVMSPAKSKYLFAIIDQRYIAHNRACRMQHTEDPEYHFPQHGAQLWVSTQDDGSGLAASYSRPDAEALFRRISAICRVGRF